MVQGEGSEAARAYHPLSAEEAVRHAAAVPPFRDTGDAATARAREVGDGNLNLVFIVSGPGGASSVVKQALPYVRMVGESWPLTIDRNRFERQAYAVYTALVPDLVPRIYHGDDALALFVMEDLSRLEVVRGGLVAGRRFPRLAGDIARFCAEIAVRTGDFYLESGEKKRAVARSINPELCKITEDLVLTDPFVDAPSNAFEPELQPDVDRLWGDEAALVRVARLRRTFVTRAESLVHGDLHTGSIMGSADETRVVDPEFSFYGPMAFDVGMFIANLFLSAVGHRAQERPGDRDHARLMLDAAAETWSGFAAGTDALLAAAPVWRPPDTARAELLTELLRDAAGFAGAEMIRRTIGLARVADLERIERLETRVRAKGLALEIGRALLRGHQTIDSFGEAKTVVARTLDGAR